MDHMWDELENSSYIIIMLNTLLFFNHLHNPEVKYSLTWRFATGLMWLVHSVWFVFCSLSLYLYLNCFISYSVNLYLDLWNLNKFKFKCYNTEDIIGATNDYMTCSILWMLKVFMNIFTAYADCFYLDYTDKHLCYNQTIFFCGSLIIITWDILRL